MAHQDELINSKIDSYFHNPGTFPLVRRTIGQQLELTAKLYPNLDAITSFHEDKTLTFSEALDQADKLAAGLSRLGLKKGNFIGIWMPNKLNWYIAMMGIARLGGICVALNPAYQTPEIEFCIKKVGIKAMITTETFKTQNYHTMLTKICPEMLSGGTRIENESCSLERVIIDSDKRLSGSLTFNETCNASESEVSEIYKLQSEIEPDDGCNIQFTSGTTGKPKAILMSHFAMLNNSLLAGVEWELCHQKICLSVPFFHIFGNEVGILSALGHAATLYLPNPGYNIEDSVRCIEKYECTFAYGTPTMFFDMVHQVQKIDAKLKSLQYAVVAGAPIPTQLILSIQESLGIERIILVYGMTETLACTSTTNKSTDPNDLGKVLDHVETKVVDDNGKTVPFGCRGELWVRSPMNMVGYYGDPEKTNETVTENKWLKTGDQFILYENGYGKVVGRSKEMIIRGGENIFPQEIEDYLITHPSVQEVYVVGVPDERMGEEIAAFIKVTVGAKNLSHEDIKTFCKGKLAHFKIPKYVESIVEFPKTASGKIQKFKLKEIFISKAVSQSIQ